MPTGAGRSRANSLLLGLAGGSTAGGGAAAVDDSIVFGVFGHRSRIAQVQAGRAWRKVGSMRVAEGLRNLGVRLAGLDRHRIWST